MKRLFLALILAALTLTAAFSSAASARQLFAPIYGLDQVAVFSGDPATGALSATAGSPFSTGAGGTTAWAMTPDGNFGVAGFLFSGFRPFTVAANGSATPSQGQIGWPAGVGSYSVAVAPGGKFVYGANRVYPGPGAAGIRAYALSPTGTLAEVAGSPYMSGTDFIDLAITPDGSKIFVVSGSGIHYASIAADGSIGMVTPQAIAGAYFVAVSPDGRFLFLTGNSGGSYLRVLAVGADGSLTQVGSSIPIGSGTPHHPVVSPDGAFVHAYSANEDQIVTVRIAPDGTPTQVGAPTPFTDGYSATISPDGKFFYISNTGSQYSLNVAPIGADGRPTSFAKTVPYDPGEPGRIVFRPGQGTIASYKTVPQDSPLTMNFDAAASTAVAGSIGAYVWDFGDGASASPSVPVTTHKFAKSGTYNVTLTTVDDSGCSTRFVYSGQSTICNGSASATKTILIDTPPWITSLMASHKTLKSKSKIKFKLTEKASVSFYVQKPLKGRKVGTSCKKQTKRNKSAKKCTRWVRASKTFRKSGKAGKTNSFKFVGKVGRKQLANGSYRIYAVATDSAKAKSPAATAKFKVKRKR